MGVWAGGPSATRVDVEGIAAAMRPAVEAWMTAHIRIYDPQRGKTGGQLTLVLDSGANGALVQPMRAPSQNEVGGQPSSILGIRFQVKRVALEEGQHLRAGLVVKVIDGGNSSGLEAPTYSLGEVLDSSIGWDYIFEAATVSGGY